MNDFIMQMRPFFGEEEKNALIEYMEEDGFITEFERTTIFENMIANFTGAKHCIAVNNGTISLTLSALALGLKAGDEVIVPNYTMIATPNSIQMFGAVPVFADVEAETLCLDIDKVEAAITPKTKAIILVSANGRYPNSGIDRLLALCSKYNLKLIEDAAQALGSYYPDRTHIGLKGHVGSFSFSAPKIISTGQGGAIVTNDDEIALKLRRLKDFGRDGGGTDIHSSIGYNFKFTELQAVIGIEQMKKLGERIERKKNIYRLYRKCLSGLKNLQIFHNNKKTTAPWFIDALVENRENLMIHLKSKGIGSRVMYPPINKQEAYKSGGKYPISDRVGTDGLWLPSMVQLTDDQIMYICKSIQEFYV